jgi:hypothetical protein
METQTGLVQSCELTGRGVVVHPRRWGSERGSLSRVEKSRYPQYEHVAVLLAEDITSRFLNVINLFNKAIPLIAIQMRALDVGGVLTLSATTACSILRGSGWTRRTSQVRRLIGLIGSRVAHSCLLR